MRVRVRMNLIAGAGLLVGGLALGCSSSDSGGGGGPNPTTAIAKTTTTSGDAQTGPVDLPLGLPLRVIVTENGTAKQGVDVNWATTSGTISNQTPTDVDGVATATWTLGTTAGPVTATATLAGASGSPVTFTATADPDVATELLMVDGDDQSGPINSTLDPLQVKVVDQFGNGISGVTVTWTVTSGDGAVAPGTSDTDANGVAESEVTLGGTIGDVTVDAEVATLTGSPQTFTEHTIALPTAIAIDVGSAGFTFSPKVDTVAAGGTVTWNWGGNGHSVISDGPQTFTSHATLENAPFTYGPITLNTVGTYNYHCSAHGSAAGGGMAGTIVVR